MNTHSNDHTIEIVFIEDSPEDADLAIRSFKKNNVANEIKLIDDGQVALDYLFGQGEYSDSGRPVTPRLVLLDLKLPKVNGLEILAKMKADPTLRGVPVVILTSSNQDMDIKRAYELGANSYIVKPVNFGKFADAIQQMGVYWMVLNQPPK
ncbi:MAG: response regulator [Cyclobacteriaceae bacterium]